MATLRKIFPTIDFQLVEIPYETLMSLQVSMDDFLEAFREIEPSVIREVFVEIPNIKWDDVGGLDDVKQILRETVEWPLKYSKLFERLHTTPSKGILLYGLPGGGKTLLAKAVASESGVNFISIKGPSLLSKWIGESEKGIREIFRKARQAAPCIIFFDEIDSIAGRRGTESSSAVVDRMVSQLLTEMDGIEDLKGILVLAATNRLDILDPAILRAGRFDFHLEIPAPNESAREAIFRIHTRGKPIGPDVNLKNLAAASDGLVGADIESICRNAALSAIRSSIQSGDSDDAQVVITAKDFGIKNYTLSAVND